MSKTTQEMQKELDNYFFFYVVWYDEIEGNCDYCPDFPHYELLDNLGVRFRYFFIFPIATEDQLSFFLENETKWSQVGALEKRTDNILLLFMSDDMDEDHYRSFFMDADAEDNRGNTHSLMKKMKNKQDLKQAIRQYIRDISTYDPDYGLELQVQANPLNTDRTIVFSDTDLMEKLLKEEHLVFLSLTGSEIYFLSQQNYHILEGILKEIEVEARKDIKQHLKEERKRTKRLTKLKQMVQQVLDKHADDTPEQRAERKRQLKKEKWDWNVEESESDDEEEEYKDEDHDGTANLIKVRASLSKCLFKPRWMDEPCKELDPNDFEDFRAY